jgi:pimeloyl-ACP methyl ester carboxylesterase
MALTMSPTQATAARVGDAILRFDGQRATLLDLNGQKMRATRQDFDGKKKNVIFIHGYTADASYLTDLMRQFDGSGFACFAFEYACYRGIDHAAKSLIQLLDLLDFDSSISGNRVVLVGHSMGGLVARAAVALFNGAKFVRKVITLGSPHDGTLQNSLLPRFIAYWGEAVGGVNPRGFGLQSTSGLQLIKGDFPPLIDRLKQTPVSQRVDFLSISGGYAQLDFGRGYWKNLLINRYLQAKLGKPNDGLVDEKSSDLSQQAFAICAPGCSHLRTYSAYGGINHTYLVNNHEVALIAVRFV